MKTKSIIAVLTAVIMVFTSTICLSGCQKENDGKVENNDLYFTNQEVKDSPKWVTKLDATKDAEQLIVVAAVDKTTAYVTMHEKQDGKWQQIIATDGVH